MFLIILGLLDIIAGGILALTALTGFEGNSILFWFAVIFLLKAIYSIGAAVAAGFFLDVLGYMDLVAAIFMFLIFWGFDLGFGIFLWFGLAMVIKGLYSFVMGVISA
jgi:hypothetical protein